MKRITHCGEDRATDTGLFFGVQTLKQQSSPIKVSSFVFLWVVDPLFPKI